MEPAEVEPLGAKADGDEVDGTQERPAKPDATG